MRQGLGRRCGRESAFLAAKSVAIVEPQPVSQRERESLAFHQPIEEPVQQPQPLTQSKSEHEPLAETHRIHKPDQQPEPVQFRLSQPVAISLADQFSLALTQPLAVTEPVAPCRRDLRDRPARTARLTHLARRHRHLLDLDLEHCRRAARDGERDL